MKTDGHFLKVNFNFVVKKKLKKNLRKTLKKKKTSKKSYHFTFNLSRSFSYLKSNTQLFPPSNYCESSNCRISLTFPCLPRFLGASCGQIFRSFIDICGGIFCSFGHKSGCIGRSLNNVCRGVLCAIGN